MMHQMLQLLLLFFGHNISESLPIGYCDIAPEIAKRKVTSDI